MYNDFIEILKGWHGAAQFVFMFFVIFTLLGGIFLIIKMIGEFFTETLPILVRGYPPMFYKKDITITSDDDEKDNDD